MKKSATLFCALFLGLAAGFAATPLAQAQANDCTELQRAVQENETPLVDAAAESKRVSVRAAAQAGLAALQCARADGDGQPIAVELNPQFAADGYLSRCPPTAPAPAPPPAGVSQAEFNAAVTTFNAWAASNVAAEACRRAEIEEIRAQVAVATAALAVLNRRTERQGAEISADLGRRLRSR